MTGAAARSDPLRGRMVYAGSRHGRTPTVAAPSRSRRSRPRRPARPSLPTMRGGKHGVGFATEEGSPRRPSDEIGLELVDVSMVNRHIAGEQRRGCERRRHRHHAVPALAKDIEHAALIDQRLRPTSLGRVVTWNRLIADQVIDVFAVEHGCERQPGLSVVRPSLCRHGESLVFQGIRERTVVEPERMGQDIAARIPVEKDQVDVWSTRSRHVDRSDVRRDREPPGQLSERPRTRRPQRGGRR